MAAATPFAEKTLALVRVTGELLKRAQAQAAEKRAMVEAIQQKIPEAVQALVEHERIFEHQKEAVAKGCEDPVQVLTLLRDVAAHRNAGEVEAIGTAHDGGGATKSASTKMAVDGAVTNWDDTESGQRFRQRLLTGR